MSEEVITRNTAAEILGKSPVRSIAQEIFVELHPGLASEEQDLSTIFTGHKAGQFLSQLTNVQALLSEEDSYDQLIAKLDGQIAQAEGVRDELLARLFETIRPIERSYRQITLFFENTKANDGRTRKPAELYIFNAEAKASKTIRSATIKSVEEFIKNRNDNFNFRKAICNLVVPGFLPQPVREKYEDVSYAYGLLMVTDTEDEKTFKALEKQFATDGKYEFLKRPEDRAAADVVTTGYLKLREGHSFEKKNDRVEKGEDLYGPPSLALAGSMVRTDDLYGLGTGPIGSRFGQIVGAEGCRFEMLITEAEQVGMERQLVPVIRDADNHLCFFGCRTLADDPYGPYKFFTAYRILRHIERMCRHYLLGVAGEPTDRANVEERVEKPLERMLYEAEKENMIRSHSLTIDKSSAKLNQGIVDIKLEVAPIGPAETFVLSIEPPKEKSGPEKRP